MRLSVAALFGITALLAAAVPRPPVLDLWDTDAKPRSRGLPSSLREVSGLAVSADGRLFAHDDESAEITELDPRTGDRRSRFGPGRVGLEGDFEGIAWAEDRLFLITSEGTVVEFPVGLDGERVAFQRHVTGLGRVCDVEGLTHDRRTRVLLVLCKAMYDDGPPGIYAFDLARRELRLEPLYAVRRRNGDDVSPSGIVVHEPSGHLLIVAAREHRLLELDRDGVVIEERKLDDKRHPQPEGIEILADGTLVISDEGGGGRGRISFYPPRGSRP